MVEAIVRDSASFEAPSVSGGIRLPIPWPRAGLLASKEFLKIRSIVCQGPACFARSAFGRWRPSRPRSWRTCRRSTAREAAPIENENVLEWIRSRSVSSSPVLGGLIRWCMMLFASPPDRNEASRRPEPTRGWLRSHEAFFLAERTPWALFGRIALSDDSRVKHLIAETQLRCWSPSIAEPPSAREAEIARRLARSWLDRRELAATLRETEEMLDQSLGELHLLETDHATGFREAKLRALGEFAAGAGHELNNPLAVAQGAALNCCSRRPDVDSARSLRAIIDQTRRAHRMLRDLMYVVRLPSRGIVLAFPTRFSPLACVISGLKRTPAKFACASNRTSTPLRPRPIPMVCATWPTS